MIEREGFETPRDHPDWPKNYKMGPKLPQEFAALSSTKVRKAAHQSDISHMVTRGVKEIILAQGLYKT